MDKIKVVWVCSFSNSGVRKWYNIRMPIVLKCLYRHLKNNSFEGGDYAIWNINALKEFEKIDDVDMHVICPVRYLDKKIVMHDNNSVHYYFFREENSSLLRWVYYQLFNGFRSKFKKNRKIIKELVDKIHPDIIQVTGAENPYYSLCVLDIPKSVPVIVQLQALLCRLVNTTQDPVEKKDFAYKGEFEKQIIKRADYIGTKSQVFRDYIVNNIKEDASFVNISIAATEPVNLSQDKKEFDFVYFSVGINKAGIDAIEAFAIAHKSYPNITLDIVGGYDSEYKAMLDTRITELGINDYVTFEGLLPTHDDVIKQIRKSKYALLPLTMDLIPSTIREAMANGLPVITSYTEGGTSKLNNEFCCALLSPVKDYDGMANNMKKLLSDANLAEEMRLNSAKIANSRLSNGEIVKQWIEVYKSCLKS